MRPSFYPTLFKSASGPRYLTGADFKNTTTLYGYQAGANGILTTAFGGIDLSFLMNDGYNTDTDHLGNSVKCLADDDINSSNNSSLVFPPDENFSLFAWVKLEDWESTDDVCILLATFNQIGGNQGGYYLHITNGNIVFEIGDSGGIGVTIQINIAHSLTGNGWHFFAVTRDVDTTYTKVYLDGQLLDSQNIATSYPEYSDSYQWLSHNIFVGGSGTCDISGTEIWVHRGTLYSQSEIETLYNIGVAA